MSYYCIQKWLMALVYYLKWHLMYTLSENPGGLVSERASDRAYEALRSEILDGVLLPGTVLGEVEQSARLGVSRTPLREALSRLTADALVEPSGRGLVVTELSTDSIRELYELRQALEEQAARLAAARRIGRRPGVGIGAGCCGGSDSARSRMHSRS